jgi:hypothetical protein
MDDPLWTWPAWKFGMKQEDLFTKLHDQYNTYTIPIQDAEAFYCDIAEISYEAQSTAEFHHLASHRRQQRLSELNKSLESASLEIIGNPKLIKMPQWEHAVRLFQTNSLDSLVRYFASYLPTDHIWHPPCQDSALAATHAFSTSLPKRRCKRHKTNEAVGSGRQTLVSSSMELGRLPAKDQLLASDKALESTCPAAFSSFSERAIKHTRPHEHSSYINHRVAVLTLVMACRPCQISIHLQELSTGLKIHLTRQYDLTRDYLLKYLSSRLTLQASIREVRECVVLIHK